MGQLKEDMLRNILECQNDGANWIAVVEWMAEEFEEVIEAIVYLCVMTWRSTSEGVWLDRLGAIVGVRRPQNEELYRVFRVRGSSDPQFDDLHGFWSSSDPDIGGMFSGAWGVPADGFVDDETYLKFIDAKIAATNADASVPGIARYVKNAFDMDCVVTAGNRVVEVEISDTFDLQTRRYIEYFAPVLAGVEFRVTNWPEF